ncbi:BnaAnng08890D [Brassica napus]|uniref:BnaAnng08890D protein n=1 Tax=Brassica napus TaxID=3708 RepID=A0A078I8R4_BRANA|nr:BnaAnng08890D [Brassica napus]
MKIPNPKKRKKNEEGNSNIRRQNTICSNENEFGSSSNSYQSRSKNKGKQPLTDTTNGTNMNSQELEKIQMQQHANCNSQSQNTTYCNENITPLTSSTFASSSKVVSVARTAQSSSSNTPRFHCSSQTNSNQISYEDYGDATWLCEHCNALMWYNERINKRRNCIPPKFSMCCMHGKIELPPPPVLPQVLLDLLFRGDSESINFIENIRAYNSMFAFTSMGGEIDASVNNGRGPFVFRLHGQNFHQIGSLLPEEGLPPAFTQLYIFDTENEVRNRISAFSSKRRAPNSQPRTLRDDTVEAIKSMLDECKPYAKILRTARDRFGDALQSLDVKIILISGRGTNEKTYNLPTTSEVAALFVGDFDEEIDARDIIVETKGNKLTRISELHPAYLPLQYPLLFPFGEDGYHIDLHLKRTTTTSKKPRSKVSMREFFAYRIFERYNQFSALMFSGKLFQQFLVDGFTMIEAERIRYLKLNQKALRADKYSNVSAYASSGNQDSTKCGKRIVLPSTYVGGARYMREKYMDAMAVCQTFGYPELFITFTCNPKWPDITRHLQQRRLKSEDRADILSRVFKMNLDSLIFEIHNKNLFGSSRGSKLSTTIGQKSSF